MMPPPQPAPVHLAEPAPGYPALARLFPPKLVSARMPALGSWSPVPPSTDRRAWEAVDADTRARVLDVAGGELGRVWPSLPASLFARFARDGDRDGFQTPVSRGAPGSRGPCSPPRCALRNAGRPFSTR